MNKHQYLGTKKVYPSDINMTWVTSAALSFHMNKVSNKYIKIVNRLIKWVTEVNFTSKNVSENLWRLIHQFVLRFPRYMQHFLQFHSGNWRICSTKIVVIKKVPFFSTLPYRYVAQNFLCIFDMAVVSTVFWKRKNNNCDAISHSRELCQWNDIESHPTGNQRMNLNMNISEILV